MQQINLHRIMLNKKYPAPLFSTIAYENFILEW